ncbi:MAG TPA: cation:proton antiporter [Acidimicrobiales bacterium]|nr:cation:proton antiporter [Acidimicrobiales bacterium]
MSDTLPFATDILVAAIAGLGVLLAHRLSEWLRVPSSVLVLAASAVAVTIVPEAHRPPQTLVERIVTVSLVAVLFSGGMGMGRGRFRSSTVPILVLGVAGTFGTAAIGAVFVHYAFGFSWYLSLLVATAVAPTDPTVVFSVLGQRRLAGRSGAILEGESGANDPVGIALMAGLIGAHQLNASGVWHVVYTFLLQMAVGAAIGVAGGVALLWLLHHLHLPGQGLDPIRTMVSAFLLYGVAAVAHGSGFLAVFVAGIVIGDQPAPHKREIEEFHSALGSLGEMAAFVALGLTVHLHVLGRFNVWGPGLALGLVLAAVIRPVVARVCLTRVHLPAKERRFVQFAGLKGAVPILLGGYLLEAGLPAAERLYGIVIVVVVFSVAVQGGLVGPAIKALRLPIEG